MRTFEIEPEVVAHDLHPAYLSTGWAKRWAEERNLPLIAVQHHHAHVAACMAEHGVTEPVIGLALDGTGYGTDGKIWGGEVLIARPDDFERFAHLAYAPLPGGEKAIREPWRMALGALQAAGFDVQAPEIFSLVGATREEARIVARMIERRLNAPLTSSCGRLFDAVAAVVLGRRAVDYEAQAAIELEGAAVNEPMGLDSPYALEIAKGDWEKREVSVLSAGVLWRSIIDELRAGVPKARIAARFHAAVAAGFVRAAVLAREATGIGTVALSGGCMHNRRLAELLRRGLEAEGFRVLRHERVSPGDGGLSYGQAVVAAARLAGR
jgi:hydrogenase maturation protein HypF